MLICDEHKFIFLRNPKTASRSVTEGLKDLFETYETGSHSKWQDEFHNWKVRPCFYEYFIFFIARNPYSRLISARKMWIDTQGEEGSEDVVYFAKNNYDLGGWKYQSDIIKNSVLPINFIRYENLEEDLNSLPFMSDKIELQHIGVQDYGDWKDHYTFNEKKKIYEYLKDDFDKFGYDKDLNLKHI